MPPFHPSPQPLPDSWEWFLLLQASTPHRLSIPRLAFGEAPFRGLGRSEALRERVLQQLLSVCGSEMVGGGMMMWEGGP